MYLYLQPNAKPNPKLDLLYLTAPCPNNNREYQRRYKSGSM